jgi:protein-tyrosine kinase
MCARILAEPDNGKAVTVMVLGCNVGDGASSVAVNLAEACADKIGEGVLLVDANMRKPSLASFYKLKAGPGLSDLVLGTDEEADVLQKVKDKPFKIVTAGTKISEPGPLLNSERVAVVLNSLKKNFRIVIVDSAAVITYSDSLFLAPKIDLSLLVVRAEKTRWEVARQAADKLDEVGAKVYGTVLNGKKFHIPKFVYNRL